MMVGAEGFEPPTLCSQRIAQPISLSCTGFYAVVLSGDYALGILGHISLSRQVPATVSATVAGRTTPRPQLTWTAPRRGIFDHNLLYFGECLRRDGSYSLSTDSLTQ